MAQTMLGKSLGEWMGDEKATRYIEARPDKQQLLTLNPNQFGEYLKDPGEYFSANQQHPDHIYKTMIDPSNFSVRDALANFWSVRNHLNLLGTMEQLHQVKEQEPRLFQLKLEDMDRLWDDMKVAKVDTILNLLYALDDLASKGTRPRIETMYEGIKELRTIATETRREADQLLKNSQTSTELEGSISRSRTAAIIFGIRMHGPDDAGNPDYIPQELCQKIYDTRGSDPYGKEEKRLWRKVQDLVEIHAKFSADDFKETSGYRKSLAKEVSLTAEFLESVLKETKLIAGALGIDTRRPGRDRR